MVINFGSRPASAAEAAVQRDCYSAVPTFVEWHSACLIDTAEHLTLGDGIAAAWILPCATTAETALCQPLQKILERCGQLRKRPHIVSERKEAVAQFSLRSAP
jgi:hypothetical protein